MGLDNNFRARPAPSDAFSLLISLLPSKFFFILTKGLSFDFYIKPADIVLVLNFFKLSAIFKLKTLAELCVVDNPFKLTRFKLSYNLLSYSLGYRVNVHTFLKEADFVASARAIYGSADWAEREA